MGMSKLRQILGRNVRLVRKHLRLSQEALANEAGIDRTYVSGIERGLRNPSINLLERLSAVLGVSPADLLAETPPVAKAEPDESTPSRP